MKSINKETGGEMEVLLSSDSVLAVNPRVTFRWSNKSADADNRTRQSGGVPDESVGLPTLKPEERTLLALADGRRSIESLAKLAGMTTPVAVRHLRALYDRGVLVTTDKSGGADATAESSNKWSNEMLAPPAITDALKNAPGEHDAAAGATGAGEVEAIVVGGSASGSTAAPGGQQPSGVVETTVPTAVSSSSPTSSRSGPAAASSGPVTADRSGPAARKHPSGPNVTLFWTPANSDSGPTPDGGTEIVPGSAKVPDKTKLEGADAPRSLTPAGVEPRARSSSPEPTVIVRSSASIVVSGSPAAARPEPVVSAKGDEGAAPSVQETPAPSVAIPFQVGSYEVATRIAQGAMGSIYVCRRVGAAGFQRLFTLKVIRQYSTQKEIAAKSFTREAQFGAMLNHPNIQTLVDVGNYDNQPFLILDYIEGTSLLDLLADDRRPSAAIVVAVMLDLLRGLQHVHDVSDEHGNRLGMVHGDVSPHNVLVGIDGVTRLTDFGSARFSNPGAASPHGEVAAGKPAYMAPEQLRGDPVDSRTDLFSVGVTMWTALTGQKLFAADTYDETAVRVMRRKIPPPSEFGAPASLDAVVLRALSRSPEGRYSSADEMARDLQAVATSEHLVAPGRDVGQWVRREFGEALADRKRKIQEAFGVPSGRGDNATSQPSQPMPARRPHRPTPKTSDGLQRLPTKTVLLEAGDIQAALGAAQAAQSAAHRERPHRPVQEASRGQWAVVIVSAVIAAFALTAAIIYLVSSLNTPPPRKPVSGTPDTPAVVSPATAPPVAPPSPSR